jgi:hypothetical protein
MADPPLDELAQSFTELHDAFMATPRDVAAMEHFNFTQVYPFANKIAVWCSKQPHVAASNANELQIGMNGAQVSAQSTDPLPKLDLSDQFQCSDNESFAQYLQENGYSNENSAIMASIPAKSGSLHNAKTPIPNPTTEVAIHSQNVENVMDLDGKSLECVEQQDKPTSTSGIERSAPLHHHQTLPPFQNPSKRQRLGSNGASKEVLAPISEQIVVTSNQQNKEKPKGDGLSSRRARLIAQCKRNNVVVNSINDTDNDLILKLHSEISRQATDAMYPPAAIALSIQDSSAVPNLAVSPTSSAMPTASPIPTSSTRATSALPRSSIVSTSNSNNLENMKITELRDLLSNQTGPTPNMTLTKPQIIERLRAIDREKTSANPKSMGPVDETQEAEADSPSGNHDNEQNNGYDVMYEDELPTLASLRGLPLLEMNLNKAETVTKLREVDALGMSQAKAPEVHYDTMSLSSLQTLLRQIGIAGASKHNRKAAIAILRRLDKSTEGSDQYENMTSKELRQLAANRGISGQYSATKSNIIAKLRELDAIPAIPVKLKHYDNEAGLSRNQSRELAAERAIEDVANRNKVELVETSRRQEVRSTGSLAPLEMIGEEGTQRRSEEGPADDYYNQGVNELRTLARQRGIRIVVEKKTLKKAEIISQLREQDDTGLSNDRASKGTKETVPTVNRDKMSKAETRKGAEEAPDHESGYGSSNNGVTTGYANIGAIQLREMAQNRGIKNPAKSKRQYLARMLTNMDAAEEERSEDISLRTYS